MSTKFSCDESEPMPISAHDVQMAVRRLKEQAHHTPVQQARSFDEHAGIATVFKCEQFQRTGAFKFRGAFNKLASLPPKRRQRGVIAFSSGNHAQAVALSARILHIPAVICMPKDVPQVKIAAVHGYGAKSIFYDRHVQNREELARDLAQKHRLTLIPPASDPAIIAGHATASWELLQEIPGLDVIAVPVGGGGLLAGTCISAKLLAPQLKIIGVQTQAANHAYLSLRQQQRVTIPPPETIADGLRTTTLGELPWSIIRRMVDDIVLVNEEEVRMAMRFLLLRLKLVVEPSGVVAAAAALTGKLHGYGRRAGVILSGGNVDPSVLSLILNEEDE